MSTIWLVVRTLVGRDLGIVVSYFSEEQAVLHAEMANDSVRRMLLTLSSHSRQTIPYDHDPIWLDTLWRYEVREIPCTGSLGEYLERMNGGSG